MNTKLLALLSLTTLFAVDEARADVVSDRVYLTTGASGCPMDQVGFRRIKQMPDGSQSYESTEFQVPYGSYLEITSVEYTTPNDSSWARGLYQQLDVMIRQRTGGASTPVLSAQYQNRLVYAENEVGTFVTIGEFGNLGAQTHVAAFPVGPLMSSAGRLCVVVNKNFWSYGGNVRVRGRLIPNGDPLFHAPVDSGRVQ